MPSSQGTKLDQYSIAARGQMRVGHKAASWAGFATAAGATLAMSGVAEATIIYSGTQNINLALTNPVGGSTSQSTAIDLDGDGQNDVIFGLQHRTAAAAPNGVQRLGGGGFLSGLGTTNGRAVFSTTGATSNVRQLSAGNIIGPGGTFGGSSSALAQGTFTFAAVTGGVATTTSATTITGPWNLNVNGFVGVQFQHNGADHYAWIRLSFEDRSPTNGQADRLTIVDWAYQATEGFGIKAGQTVPEPTPLALLAAGAVGIGSFRRKRKAAATSA
jgi:hypothetical protein